MYVLNDLSAQCSAQSTQCMCMCQWSVENILPRLHTPSFASCKKRSSLCHKLCGSVHDHNHKHHKQASVLGATCCLALFVELLLFLWLVLACVLMLIKDKR
jgi:hypothetical protein